MISADQIRHRLKLRHLNVLLAVAEQGSMIKAAEQLAISQPVVSKAIADLEHTLGVRLLERGQRGVEPTSCGRALLRRSIAIFDDLRASVRELESLADPTTGELRVGSTEAMGTSLVPMIIEQMSKEYPRIRFEIVMADPVTLRERELRGRRVDLVIGQRITPGFDTDDLNVTALFNDRLRIVAAKSNPWAARRKIALADLIGERWCLPPPDHPVGALVHEAFRRRKLTPPVPVVEAQTAPFTCSLVAGGQYLGVLGLVFLGSFDRLAAIKVLPVDLPIGEWPVSILTLKNRTPNPATRLFVDHAQELVRSLAKGR